MRSCYCIAAITLLSVGMAARADTIQIIGSGVEDTFSLPATPTVSDSGSYGFSIKGVPVDENGVQVFRQIFFFSEDLGGGLRLSSSAAGADVNAFGAQLYSGASNSPIFIPGTFFLSGFGTYTVTIEATAVPEPGSVLLLSLGFFAVGGLLTHQTHARRTSSVSE